MSVYTKRIRRRQGWAAPESTSTLHSSRHRRAWFGYFGGVEYKDSQ